jgi:hypothetical protein
VDLFLLAKILKWTLEYIFSLFFFNIIIFTCHTYFLWLRTFGTFSIYLPSEFTGGELDINYAGIKISHNLAPDTINNLHFTAFYNNCEYGIHLSYLLSDIYTLLCVL